MVEVPLPLEVAEEVGRVVGRMEVELNEVVLIGHQVVYSVTTSLMVTVAVETIAGETVSVQAWSSQEVMVTKVVDSSVAVAVVTLEAAEATAAIAAMEATVENCISKIEFV